MRGHPPAGDQPGGSTTPVVTSHTRAVADPRPRFAATNGLPSPVRSSEMLATPRWLGRAEVKLRSSRSRSMGRPSPRWAGRGCAVHGAAPRSARPGRADPSLRTPTRAASTCPTTWRSPWPTSRCCSYRSGRPVTRWTTRRWRPSGAPSSSRSTTSGAVPRSPPATRLVPPVFEYIELAYNRQGHGTRVGHLIPPAYAATVVA